MNDVTVSWSLADEGAQPEAVLIVASGPTEADGGTAVVRPELATGEVPQSARVVGLRNGVRYGFVVIPVSALGAAQASAPVYATPTSGVDGEVAGLIVNFAEGHVPAPGSSDVPGEQGVDQVGLQVAGEVGDQTMLVEFTESVDVSTATQVARDLAADPAVEWAEPDLFVSGATAPSTTSPSGGDQWNLDGEFGIGLSAIAEAAVSSETAADAQAGQGVTVAVIDTGVTEHPELAGRLVGGYDFVSSPAELAADRAGDGSSVAFDGDYVDTARFGGLGRDANPADPGDWRSTAPARSSTWHGTKVAGVISAVAPAARIQPVRALSWRGGLLSDIAASVTWASGGSIDGVPANATPSSVINLSFSVQAPCPRSLQDAIDGARGRGAVLVAAAGNAGTNAGGYAPGNCTGVITTGATGVDGKRAAYSNHGAVVDISAPGSAIATTSNTGAQGPDAPATADADGTSIAAAHVSAAAARYRSTSTGSTPDQVTEYLTGKAVRAFPGDTCDDTLTTSCGTGILTLAQVATLSAGGTGATGIVWTQDGGTRLYGCTFSSGACAGSSLGLSGSDPDVSPDGAQIVYNNSNNVGYIANIDGANNQDIYGTYTSTATKNRTEYGQNAWMSGFPRWSVDGDFVFGGMRAGNSLSGIFVYDCNSSNFCRNGPANETAYGYISYKNMNWSNLRDGRARDGSVVQRPGGVGGALDLYFVVSDGTNRTVNRISWTPGFPRTGTASNSGTYASWEEPSAFGAAARSQKQAGWTGRWSPDGTKYFYEASSNLFMYEPDVGTGRITQLSGGSGQTSTPLTWPNVSPNGQWLGYYGGPTGFGMVSIADAVDGISDAELQSVTLSGGTGGFSYGFDWIPAQTTPQTITLGALPSKTYGDAGFSIASYATVDSSSGLPISFTSSTPSVCTVTSVGLVSIVGAGACTIAGQAAGGSVGGILYADSNVVTQSFTVAKASQTITFSDPGPHRLTDSSAPGSWGSFAVSATASSGLTVTFTATPSSVCAVDGTVPTQINMIRGGTCTITAQQAGNGNFLAAADRPYATSVLKLTQSITFPDPGDQVYGFASTFLVAPTTTAVGLAPAVSSETTSVCTVSGMMVTTVSIGTCTLSVAQSGSDHYSAAQTVRGSIEIINDPMRDTSSQIVEPGTGAATYVEANGSTHATTLLADGPAVTGVSPVFQPGNGQVQTMDDFVIAGEGEQWRAATGGATPTPDYEIDMALAGATADAATLDPVTATLVFVTGKDGLVTGSGFKPNSIAEIWIFSQPTFLGYANVDSSGDFSELFTIPVSLQDGAHTVQAEGLTRRNAYRAVNAGVRVESPAAPLGSVPLLLSPSTPSRGVVEAIAIGTDRQPLLDSYGDNAVPPTGSALYLYPDGTSRRTPARIVGNGLLAGDPSDLQMTLTGGEQGATRVDERRQQLVFFTNKKGVARGTGFLPGSQAEVWLFSTPTSLGTTSVRADGSWEIEFLVPGDVAAGQHTIQAEGTGPDGQDRALAALVAVDTDPGIARNRKVTKTMVLTFDPMSSNLNPKQEHELKRLLRGKGLYKVRTTGYVQPAGMTRNDLKLSWERAMAAAAFIDRRRLVLQTDINFSGVAKGRRAAGKDACAKVENRCTVVELVYRRG